MLKPKFDVKDWAMFGGIGGLLMPLFMKVLAMIPSVQVTFSVIEFNIRNKITGFAGEGVTNFLIGLTGQSLSLPSFISSIIGVALLVVAGRYIYDLLNLDFKEVGKYIAVFVLASVLQFLILVGFGIPSVAALIGFVINAVVTAFVIKLAYKHLGLKLPN